VVRRLGSVLAALLVAGVLASAGAVAPVAAASPVPKVVIVVGPVGAMTEGFRREARAAAAAARRYTPDVTEIYSPNATWTAVKAALQGASLVVYMGHGNGWPSRYRDALYRPTQDGFGLNPSAGGNDSTHQYFGEGRIAASVKLAKDAVVLLHHLCYASGLSEPDLPEGTLDQARQRVDNFAAGFIAAGASAVIAEAYDDPSGYVKAILGGDRSIDAIWRSAPTANDHVFGFESQRSPGYIAQVDPKHATSGFERSIVLRAGLVSADVRAGARGSAGGGSASVVPGAPDLLATGVTLGTPSFKGLTAAGGTAILRIPFTIKDRGDLPDSVQASVRWDPIDVAPAPTEPATEVAVEPAMPAVVPSPSPAATSPIRALTEPDDAPAAGGAVTATPSTTPEPLQPTAPPVDVVLVAPEQTGDVVAPADLKLGSKYLSVPVVMPTAPGRYRLTITLHDGDGVAYDAATQATIPTLAVRVTGDVDGAILVAPTATLTAGTDVELPVRVVNLGTAAWGHGPTIDTRSRFDIDPAVYATLVGRWLSLSDGMMTPIPTNARVDLPAGLEPRVTVDATLELAVPDRPGDFLLVLDVLTPEHGSLIAAGVEPTIVRVTVVP
jgi:hypothetical protein